MRPEEVAQRCQPVPGVPVYAVGVKEAAVTVASQQRRAIHLVDALRLGGVLAAGSRLAVVGGGAAGLTAAAWAARAGVEVTLLERDLELLPTLRGNHTRLLHPNLYAWPDERWRVRAAGLPILSWEAAPAGRVAERIRCQFRDEARASGLIDVRLGVTLAWPWPPPRREEAMRLSWSEPAGAASGCFSAVILAVGFGRERRTGDGFPGYWQDDWVQEAAGPTARRYLIHGAGDGGLTDLLRLKLTGFEQDAMAALLEAALGDARLAELAGAVRALEERCAGDNAALHAGYLALDVPWLEDALERAGLRPHQVTIVDRYPALGTRRFPLNKLFASRLVRAGRAWGVEWLHRELDDAAIGRAPDGGWLVALDGAAAPPARFDRVLVRCGTSPAIDAFGAAVADGCGRMARGADPLAAAPCPAAPPPATDEAALAAVAAGAATHDRALELVRQLLRFLRHAGRGAEDLAADVEFVDARRRALRALDAVAASATFLEHAPAIGAAARAFLERREDRDVAVAVRALVEAVDILWGERLSAALRGRAGRATSCSFAAGALFPRRVYPDDARGRRDDGLARLALLPAGRDRATIVWTADAWPRDLPVWRSRRPRSMSELVLGRGIGASFFGATPRDAATYREPVAAALAALAAGGVTAALLPEFALAAAPDALDGATFSEGFFYAGVGHVVAGARRVHQRLLAVPGRAPERLEKGAASRYAVDDAILEEAIHLAEEVEHRAVCSADERAAALLVGEDCDRPSLLAFADALRPTVVLGVGGPIAPALGALVERLEERRVRCVVVGFGKELTALLDD